MMFHRKYKPLAVAILFVVVAGIAVAAGMRGRSLSSSSGDLERAVAAALAATGPGQVTESEVSDENDGYEVEVTLDNGRKVEVHLDANFKVIDQEFDDVEDGDEDDKED